MDGEPPPSKEWTKDGNKLEDGIHLGLFNESYKTTIRVAESRRSDSGVYELYAKNVNGTDRCTCNVTVLDVPGPPENLQVTNKKSKLMNNK